MKTYKQIFGVRVDGTGVATEFPVPSGYDVCTSCRGYGDIENSPIDPSLRVTFETCQTCKGEGIIQKDSQ